MKWQVEKQGAINGLYKDKAMPSFRAVIKVQHYVKTCTVRESSQSFVPQIFPVCKESSVR